MSLLRNQLSRRTFLLRSGLVMGEEIEPNLPPAQGETENDA